MEGGLFSPGVSLALGLLGLAFGGWSLHRRDSGRPLHRYIVQADLYLILASLPLIVLGMARVLKGWF